MEQSPKTPPSAIELYYRFGKGAFIPSCIKSYAGNFPPQEDKIDQWRQDTAQKVEEFVKWAPTYLQEELFYKPFCEKEELMTTAIHQTRYGAIKINEPMIPFREQTNEALEQDQRWIEFMNAYTPPRENLLEAVTQVLNKIPRRDSRYNSMDIQMFDESMTIGSYTIALALLPRITDSEVKNLFGQLTSLAQIRSLVALQRER